MRTALVVIASVALVACGTPDQTTNIYVINPGNDAETDAAVTTDSGGAADTASSADASETADASADAGEVKDTTWLPVEDSASPPEDTAPPPDTSPAVDAAPPELVTTFPSLADPQHLTGDFYGSRTSPDLASASRLTTDLYVYCPNPGCGATFTLYLGTRKVYGPSPLTDAQCSSGYISIKSTFAPVAGVATSSGYRYDLDTVMYIPSSSCGATALRVGMSTVTIR